MNVIVREVSSDYIAWNQNLSSVSNASTFLQSSFWGEFLADAKLATPIFLLAEINNKPAGLMLVVNKNIAPKKYIFLKNLPYIFSRLEIQQGPVCFDYVNKKEVLITFLNWIDKYKKTNKIGEVNFDSFIPSLNLSGIKDLMKSLGYTPQRWATYYVDLSVSREDLLANIDHSARKGINKALREGVVVKKLNTWDEFEKLYLLPYMALKESPPEMYDNHKKLWNNKNSFKYYSFFVCEDSYGQLLGMLGVFIFSGVATEIASGVTSIGFAKKIPVQDLLHWEIMIYSKSKNCHIFDLAGVSPNPMTIKENNILRFKKKWGGIYIEYDTFFWRHTLVVIARAFNNRLKSLKALLY